MSRGIKLVLMGVAGAALLYSCTPGIGAGLGALPYLWFLSNPFYRGPAVSSPATTSSPSATTLDASKAAPSQRGGFGATGSSASSSGAS
ncbi:MAG: hypothetical protein ACXU9B_18255 [Reyranella sp.]